MYVLDTDICIYALGGRAPEVVERLRIEPVTNLSVTSITAAELRYGALRSERAKENSERVERFLAPLKQFGFGNLAAVHFAAIKAQLAGKGNLIGPMDMLIAAIVRSMDATLVTNNVKVFNRVPNLSLENWKS